MSDQVIAEIERCVNEWEEKLNAHVMIYYAGDGWVVSCHMHCGHVRNKDVMAALREFDGLVRQHLKQTDMLARTLGLEAAE